MGARPAGSGRPATAARASTSLAQRFLLPAQLRAQFVGAVRRGSPRSRSGRGRRGSRRRQVAHPAATATPPATGPARGQRGRAPADGQAGPLLPVLLGGGPAVVLGHDARRSRTDRADPHSARVPLAGPAGQRGAPPGPVTPSGLVAYSVVIRSASSGSPAGAPRPTGASARRRAAMHRVLDRAWRCPAAPAGAAGSTPPGRRPRSLDPPVLGPGVAQLSTAASGRPGSHQRGPLQRLGPEPVLG